MSERAITFSCGSDELVGILHHPDSDERDLGIVIIVGGPQYRVGSHRQFVRMARMFAAAGYPTFRFDYRGMGDSSGEPRTFESVDDDVRAAVDSVLRHSPTVSRVVLFGLCDAASAVLMYGHSDARVNGLILANPWVRTEAGEAKAFIRHYYAHRILQRSFWQKVLNGEFHLLASVRGFFTSLGRIRNSIVDGRSGGEAVPFLERMEDGLAAFHSPVLLLSSERDLTAREFESLCRDAPRWRELTTRGNVQTARIEGADHTFSTAGTLERAASISLEWLARTGAS